jgi:hypothetical protein
MNKGKTRPAATGKLSTVTGKRQRLNIFRRKLRPTGKPQPTVA